MRLHYSINPEWLERPIQIWQIGAGGNGSEMIEILARMHQAVQAFGHPHGFQVTLWDGGTVTEANIVRQRFWACDIGHNKASLTISRFNAFLGTNWSGIPRPFRKNHVRNSRVPDLVIGCVDSVASRKTILAGTMRALCHPSHECLYLDLGNGTHTGQVVLGHLNCRQNAIRLPHVFDLFSELNAMEDDNRPSCSAEDSLLRQTFGVNKTMAVCAGNLLWSLLTQPKIDHHGVYVDSRSNRVNPIWIDPVLWQSLGLSDGNTCVSTPPLI